jgi:hypothetical protein
MKDPQFTRLSHHLQVTKLRLPKIPHHIILCPLVIHTIQMWKLCQILPDGANTPSGSFMT